MLLWRKVASKLPGLLQNELKRMKYGTQIKIGSFVSNEPEYDMLESLIGKGDWIIDVGANVGHYTKRFSELVGGNGRVIAFEPVPSTFFLLSSNVQLFTYSNVSLINAAVSDHIGIVGMSLPVMSTGLVNFYRASVAFPKKDLLSVLTLSLDSFIFEKRIALIKIDAEGHESYIFLGMQRLIKEHHPILIIETFDEKLINNLTKQGYSFEKLDDSPNLLFRPAAH